MLIVRLPADPGTEVRKIIAYLTAEEWSKFPRDYKSAPGAELKSVMAMCPFSHGTRLFPARIIGKARHLECSCCGGDAGQFVQWHNQDDGYGMCAGCIDSLMDRGPEYLARHEIDLCKTWGIPGVHRAPAKHETADVHTR